MSSNSNSSITILFMRLVREKSEWKEILSSLTYESDDPSNYSIVDIDVPNSGFYRIYGHSHTLICLSVDKDDIFLYNSTTSELNKLPPSILPRLEPVRDLILPLDSRPITIGFGYDPKSNDFKVVRLVEYSKFPCHLYPLRVELYCLSTNQWREIDLTTAFGYLEYTPSFEMYHDGFYYWRVSIHRKEYIQSFDMTKEVFRAIPVPDCFEGGPDTNCRSLGVWNGSVAMFHYPNTGFDIWGMMKHDESGGVSWSKLLTLCPVSGIQKPLLFVNSYELLMEAENGQVICYNVNTKDFKKLPVKGPPRNINCFAFAKTLSSLKGGSRHHHSAFASASA